MPPIDIDQLKGLMQPNTPKPAKPTATPDFELDDDGEEYMPVGVGGLVSATEKILAVNRGLVDTDERDSLKFQKVFRPHAMLRESIKMDAGKTARSMLYRAATRKNLQGVTTFAFDPYVERLMIGNPLTTPLEEINPMQLVESARRITKMGPGGLGSSRAITNESQAVHPSQFGFISTVEGPECFAELPDSKLYTKQGWLPVELVTLETELACRINGVLEFHKPTIVIHERYKGPVYGVRHKALSFLVTPGHRLYGCTPEGELKIVLAKDAFNKLLQLPCSHAPYTGIPNTPNMIDEFVEEYIHEASNYCVCSRCIPEEVFDWEPKSRQALLDALLHKPKYSNPTHNVFRSHTESLVDAVERLMIGLGWGAGRSVRVGRTTTYMVKRFGAKTRCTDNNQPGYASYWYKQQYDGMVHCAAVPGGLLYYSAEGRPGCWTGNSEKAGIDVRVAWGAKLGSNGRLYQKFYDRHRKGFRWMSPDDLDGLTIKIPD